jgi:hypothetical protein
LEIKHPSSLHAVLRSQPRARKNLCRTAPLSSFLINILSIRWEFAAVQRPKLASRS